MYHVNFIHNITLIMNEKYNGAKSLVCATVLRSLHRGMRQSRSPQNSSESLKAIPLQFASN